MPHANDTTKPFDTIICTAEWPTAEASRYEHTETNANWNMDDRKLQVIYLAKSGFTRFYAYVGPALDLFFGPKVCQFKLRLLQMF
jgi:hypothetical protein